jgi:hypothetical protein
VVSRMSGLESEVRCVATEGNATTCAARNSSRAA